MADVLDGLRRGSFRAIACDPPWFFRAGTKGRPQHYARMRDAEIKALPVADLAHPDGCWLFLWTTSPRLHLVFDIARAWGFRYSGRAFLWIKTKQGFPEEQFWFHEKDLHLGQGFTTRKNAEDVLLFRRGKPKRIAKDVREIIIAPRRQHSRKPDIFYERVEAFCAGPYADLFSRQSRVNWDACGLEAGKFDGDTNDTLQCFRDPLAEERAHQLSVPPV